MTHLILCQTEGLLGYYFEEVYRSLQIMGKSNANQSRIGRLISRFNVNLKEYGYVLKSAPRAVMKLFKFT